MDLVYFKIFNILYNQGYDSFVELLWENRKESKIEDKYNDFREEYFKNSNFSKKDNEGRLQVLNSVINIYKAFEENLESIDENSLDLVFSLTKDKINTYKSNWFKLVLTHAQQNNPKKYITKEWHSKNSSFNSNDGNYDNFVKSRIDEITKWNEDGDCLLSDFLYIDDLLKQQLNLIFKLEPLYIILKEIVINNDDELKKIVFKGNKKKKNIEGGKVPNIILSDGIFRVNAIDISKDTKGVVEDDENYVLRKESSMLQLKIPKKFYSEGLDANFDYTKDVILTGGFEMAVTTALLDVGNDQLLNSNKITFTFPQICENMGLEKNGWSYDRIEKALFNLFVCAYVIELPDFKDRYFHILSAIERPTYISSGQKEWTVELDSLLREQILLKNHTAFHAKQLNSFKLELTPILFKILTFDLVSNQISTRDYTLKGLSERTYIEGKPSKRKERLKKSLDEIIKDNNSIINSYEVKDNDVFRIYFKQEALS